MDEIKRKGLETAGWKTGDAADFLDMSSAERQLLEARVELALPMRRQHDALHVTQGQLLGGSIEEEPTARSINRPTSR